MDVAAYLTDGGTLVMGRAGHAPSPPALVANVVLRLALCPLALLMTIVPLRMLWRNGEFPACAFVVCTQVMTLIVFVNAALWRNQDFDSWWLGFGWCDLQSYVSYSLVTFYSACVCAIMQRLSSQVGLTRVAALSRRERRNQLILQAAIIFPVPILQTAVTIFVQGIRYAIIPGNGCLTQYNVSPVVLVFYVLPPSLFTLVSCFHTFYRKFREVDADCRAALADTNTVAFMRRQRARRKLYFMVTCILIPYTPLTITLCAFNIISGWPWNYPVDFYTNHYGGPNPWNTVILFGYSDVTFMAINLGWIPVVSAFIAFIFFGTSKEAINMHRTYMLALGLGFLFPRLHTPYDPDRSGATSLFNSNASSAATQLTALASTCDSRKNSVVPQSYSVPAASPGFATSETGSQSNFLAAVVSRDDGDILQRPPPSTLRRWYTKAQSMSFSINSRHTVDSMDHELEDGLSHGNSNSHTYEGTPASYSPPPPPARTPFNPGLNWLAPMTANSTYTGAPRWKPVVFGQRTHKHKKVQSGSSDLGVGAPFPAPPSSASTAPILQAAHAQSTNEAVPAPFSPFDGTTVQGQRAVSTHVWSEGDEGPGHASSSGSGGIAETQDTTANEPQQGRGVVHVERSITSQVTL